MIGGTKIVRKNLMNWKLLMKNIIVVIFIMLNPYGVEVGTSLRFW